VTLSIATAPASATTLAYQLRPIEKSANFTAELDRRYDTTATLTVTNPTPAPGRGFEVLVVNGTATINGTAYAAGVLVRLTYHSGSWVAIVMPSLGRANTWAAVQTVDLGTGALPALISTAATLRLANADSVNTAIQCDTVGAPAFLVDARRVSGTRASPTATGYSENIILLRAYGFGSSLTTNRSGSYAIRANSLWSESNQETAHIWEGTPSASTTVATWMTLSGTRLNVALTTPSTSSLTGALTVAGGIGVGGAIYAGGIISNQGLANNTIAADFRSSGSDALGRGGLIVYAANDSRPGGVATWRDICAWQVGGTDSYAYSKRLMLSAQNTGLTGSPADVANAVYRLELTTGQDTHATRTTVATLTSATVAIAATTDATSPTAAALTVAGGLGVNGAAWIAGSATGTPSAGQVAIGGGEVKAAGPITAGGFRSARATVNDDSVLAIALPTTVSGCVVNVITNTGTVARQYYGSAACYCGSTNQYAHLIASRMGAGAAGVVAVTTGVLAGTTGTDGNLTISAGDGILYIENRIGAAVSITVSIQG
jgi:hypothetical protein